MTDPSTENNVQETVVEDGSTKEEDIILPLNGTVGFHSLPDQEIAKFVQKSFPFNILCIGETGLGKTTFLETLFNSYLELSKKESATDAERIQPASLEVVHKEFIEGKVTLAVTIVESKGFGDEIDKRDSVKHIVEDVEQRLASYLKEELLIYRPPIECIPDARIHVCFYFLSPTGHTLKSHDLVAMQALHDKVNLIPVIAKGDALTREELSRFKVRITSELTNNAVQMYRFPTDETAIRTTNEALNALSPFSVMGAPVSDSSSGRPPLSNQKRSYPWGTLEVNNPMHSDVAPLRTGLLGVNLAHLVHNTHMVHYRNFRARRLVQMGFSPEDTLPSAVNTMDEYDYNATTHTNQDPAEAAMKVFEGLRSLQIKKQAAQEEEIRAKFVLRVQQKEEELREAEKKMNQQFDTIKRQLAEDRRRLEEKKRLLEEERGAWERRKSSDVSHGAATFVASEMHQSSSSGRFTLGTPSLIHKKNKK